MTRFTSVSPRYSEGTISKDQLLLATLTSAKEQCQSGFLARPDSKRWKYDLPINWKTSPFKDRNWEFSLSAWRILDSLINDCIDSKSSEWLPHAMDIILDWYDFNIAQDNTFTMQWYDMAAGLRAMRLAFMFEQIALENIVCDLGTTEILDEIATAHVNFLSTPEHIALNNHGIFQVCGLHLLAQHWCRPYKFSQIDQYCKDCMRKIVDENYTAQGVQKEAAPDYQKYVTEIFLRVMRGFDFTKEFQDLVKTAHRLLPYFAFPDGMLPPIGDSQGDKAVNCLTQNTKSDLARLKNKDVVLKDLSKSGLIIVRSPADMPQQSQWMLYFTAMAHTRSHKHADELSFCYYNSGHPIITDPGKYAYEYDKWRDYALSANSHSNVSIAERPVIPASIGQFSGSFLKTVENRGDFLLLRGEINRAELFDHARRIRVYENGEILVEDTIKNLSRNTLQSNMCIDPSVEVEMMSDSALLRTTSGDTFLLSVQGHDFFRRAYGEKEPLLGWNSKAYKKMSPTHLLIASGKPGEDARIVWRLTKP